MKKISIMFLLIFTAFLFADGGKIVGKVVLSEDGQPFPGASITLKGTSIGTTTNQKGRFSLTNVPKGKYTIIAKFIGFSETEKKIVVNNNETSTIKFSMERKSIQVEGMKVSANRAKDRETPIAFVDLSEEELKDKYTTEDMPELLSEVPGLFSSSTGMGESEITMRGFEADKIQVMVNGIPVNDPESQKVYWSNWTGLSSNVKSVQVQKGAGSSLYGSGAFGGSVNIETMDAAPKSEITVRSSVGGYSTDGKVADGQGDVVDYNPFNYNLLVKYNSGLLWDGKFNYNINLERKAGDSYIEGTNYDGYSFGIETQSKLGDHKVNFSLIAAPQEHNNVYSKSDINLFKHLGREYNRQNHKYQENKYFKPQMSLRDEWQISEDKLLMTNVFATTGIGGGSYLSNDKFDVATGKVYYRDEFFDDENPEEYQFDVLFDHARYLAENYGVYVEGLRDTTIVGIDAYHYEVPVDGYTQSGITTKDSPNYDFWSSQYQYSWKNYSVSDHQQVGGNTYFDYQVLPEIKLIFGGEARYWTADHRRERENLRVFDPNYEDNIRTIDNAQNQYDYNSTVFNMSGFTRAQYKYDDFLNIMFDVQFARYMSKIEESPIELYDVITGEKLGYSIYSTQDIVKKDSLNTTVVDDNGNVVKKFDEDDYEKVYKFISPKTGINLNLTDDFNVMGNYSIAYKEPKTRDWYDGSYGPDGRQSYSYTYIDSTFDEQGNLINEQEKYVEKFYGELDPERISTIEFGLGYSPYIFGVNSSFKANYYYSLYDDKIDSKTLDIVDPNGKELRRTITTNVGEAVHQGLEVVSSFKLGSYDLRLNATFANNEWQNGDYENKSVRKAPDRMLNGGLGYTYDFRNESQLSIGADFKWWNGYYANNDNNYTKLETTPVVYDADGNYDSSLNGDVDLEETYVYNGVTYYKNSFNGDDNLQDENLYIVSGRTVSSELPEFLEFSANVKYSFTIMDKDASIRLDLNNITNRENYSSAIVAKDYNRVTENANGELVDDYLNSEYNLYFTPAPLFNFFITTEVKF